MQANKALFITLENLMGINDRQDQVRSKSAEGLRERSPIKSSLKRTDSQIELNQQDDDEEKPVHVLRNNNFIIGAVIVVLAILLFGYGILNSRGYFNNAAATDPYAVYERNYGSAYDPADSAEDNMKRYLARAAERAQEVAKAVAAHDEMHKLPAEFDPDEAPDGITFYEEDQHDHGHVNYVKHHGHDEHGHV
jgi:hypothetical protein